MDRSNRLPASFGLILERRAPAIAAFAIAAIWFFGGKPFPAEADGLYGTAATVASVFAGFVGAAGAIILTIRDTPLFKELSKHGYAQLIIHYMRDALFVATAFAGISLAGFFVSEIKIDFGIPHLPLFRALWIYLAIFSIFSFIRAARILFLLLRQSAA